MYGIYAAPADLLDVDLVDFAELAVGDVLPDDLGLGALAADHAHLEKFAGGVARGDNLAAEVGVEAHGLFEEDVLAGLEGVDGDGGVEVVRHADGDGLDFGVGEKVVVVLVGLGDAVAFGLGLEGFGVDVAEGDDVRVRDLGVGVRVDRSNRSDADDADFDFSAHGNPFRAAFAGGRRRPAGAASHSPPAKGVRSRSRSTQ